MEKEIYFAGGCFWGVEKYFGLIKGVVETAVGYANGTTENPSYEDVCRKNTGHAETVKVVYDSKEVNLSFLLDMFFEIIDPTLLNRQGNDVGVQYRTGIYYIDESDFAVVNEAIHQLQQKYDKPIVVEVKKLENFYLAEAYHQNYLEKTPGGYCHIGIKEFTKARDTRRLKKPQTFQKKEKRELQQELTDVQYKVTQESYTEPAFQNEYFDHFQKGIYVDITTGEPLFVSTDKFEAGCGWPSFSKPIEEKLVTTKKDMKFGMIRTEVKSKTGDAHLGHVFEDGPKKLGGLRYCINSAALRFVPLEEMEKSGYGEYVELVH